jgi:serine/threonine protein kinase
VPGEPLPEATSSGDDEPLARLLAQALEIIERGDTVVIAELCKDHPELQDAVAAALRQAPTLRELHRSAGDVDQQLGSSLGDRYQLEQRIGAGAMGVVYAARDQRLQRDVAIKVLRPDLVVGARMDARLAREAEVLAKIRHPNVVTVHDRGRAGDGRTFLVLERLQGCTLAELLRGEAAPGTVLSSAPRLARFRQELGEAAVTSDSDVRQVVDWAVQACRGVEAAHDAGVVHRDLKPSNLFLERLGRVVVLDFGIVSVGENPTVGSDGYPLGTPAYMPPEQVQPSATPDVRWDVYGLAATLYHLLTGRAPYSGTLPQVLDALRHHDPVPADRMRPGLPGDLVAVLEKGMARSPHERYATVAEFADDLVAWREFRPVTARRRSWFALAQRRLGRSPFARALALLVLLLTLVGAGWQWSTVHAAQRAEREGTFWAQLPPSLINDLPQNRSSNALRRDAELDRMLAEWVEIAESPWVPHALRAIHRSDGGDFAGAAADVAAIAQLGSAPFAEVALAAYREQRLPEVTETSPAVGGFHDRFLLVLHAIRSLDLPPPWVRAMVEADDAVARQPGFAELWLILRMFEAHAVSEFSERVHAFEALERSIAQVQERRQLTSAILLHIDSLSMLSQGRVAEARSVVDRGLALAPRDFSLELQLAAACLRAGALAVARAACERAIVLQPRSLQAHETLSDVLLAEGRIDDAERLLAAPVFAVPPRGVAVRHRQQGLVWLARHDAARSAAAADPSLIAVARGHAERARDSFAAADVLAVVDVALEQVYCRALLGEGFSYAELFALLAEQPLDADLLERAAGVLPASLDAEAIAALASLLRAQAAGLGSRER